MSKIWVLVPTPFCAVIFEKDLGVPFLALSEEPKKATGEYPNWGLKEVYEVTPEIQLNAFRNAAFIVRCDAAVLVEIPLPQPVAQMAAPMLQKEANQTPNTEASLSVDQTTTKHQTPNTKHRKAKQSTKRLPNTSDSPKDIALKHLFANAQMKTPKEYSVRTLAADAKVSTDAARQALKMWRDMKHDGPVQ